MRPDGADQALRGPTWRVLSSATQALLRPGRIDALEQGLAARPRPGSIAGRCANAVARSSAESGNQRTLSGAMSPGPDHAISSAIDSHV